MEMTMARRFFVICVGLLVLVGWAGAAERVYYYVAPYMDHPFIYDQHLGFKYAADKFGVEIIRSGPSDFDTKAATEAFEQAIAKKPDGIVTVMWDGSLVPAVKDAMARGIPVVVVESAVENHGALTYIGLDNYGTGVETAQELLRVAGESGKLIIHGNWGAGQHRPEAQRPGGLSESLSRLENHRRGQ